MTTIKITSNPYDNTIEYAKRSDAAAAWEEIATDLLYTGKLVTSYFATGFFPFKADEIVEELVEEYGSGAEALELVFEGSDDEYASLEAACSEERVADKVALSRAQRYLLNAREVIKDVVNTFAELDPLIRESTEDKDRAQEDLGRISEASSNIVPICVLGNYSSGKSTFINALIGAEYLPSAAMPLTAKAYKITRKLQRNGASIRFTLDGIRQVELEFDHASFSQSGLMQGEPLLEKLQMQLASCKTDELVEHVNRAIMVVNEFEKDTDEQRISDMVEVDVPFNEEGLLGRSDNDYVIFDTPGSNSVMYKNHLDVLKRALEGMSNGIPVFVSVYDQLDSDDAGDLSEQIRNMKGLDSRFTMIVVSKADQASLPEGDFSERDVEELKRQAVVDRLYSNGLYFVSSLMGLGAKNGGEFLDSSLRRPYVQQCSAYSDSQDEFYTRLYRYNIMPGQMKREAIAESESLDDLVLANSGLHCVEYEIENFSDKYAAYNKCRQMEQALENAYLRATRDTEAEIDSRERTRDMLGEKLDDDTSKLVLDVNAAGKQLRNEANRGYPLYMERPVADHRSHKTRAQLREVEAKISEVQKLAMSLVDEQEDVAEAWDGLFRGLKRNFGSIVENMDASSVATAKDDFVRAFKSVRKEQAEVFDARAKVARATVDEMLRVANGRVRDDIRNATETLDNASQQYWRLRSDELKEAFSRIIAGASVLPEQTRARIGEQIVRFSPLEFETDIVFSKDEFVLRPLDLVVKGRLARAYNQAVNDAVSAIADTLHVQHQASFSQWADALEEMIVSDITELSPALREQVGLIANHNARIAALRQRQAKLHALVSQVQAKIDWKTTAEVEA
ncbi:MAG: dynamin family protein [Eggerthellaceae bacterium]|nr:dynamin family protein [Eggerthellaceae bacterium]